MNQNVENVMTTITKPSVEDEASKNEMMKALYDATQMRPRPEDVAALVQSALEGKPLVTSDERLVIGRAASKSAKHLGWKFSSMLQDFVRPKSGAANTLGIASKVLNIPIEPITAVDAMNPDKLRRFAHALGHVIAKGHESVKLTREQRHAIGMYKNARWYNKRWRLLCRLERKIDRLAFNQRRYLFTRVANSGLAVEISKDDLTSDLDTACFIAYYSSRMSLRSTFTNTSQVRAFDEVAEVLLKRCEANPNARWYLIAHVLPDERVMKHLDARAKGELLGRWWELLVDMADMLHGVFKTQDFKLETMIVSSGNDSSTWNAVAGAWNKAREQWFSILHAMHMESMLDVLCPGKVMRLMAADVARWHASSGGDVHPDTKVWAILPPPWLVVRGVERCTADMVMIACNAVGKRKEDREKLRASWTGPKSDRTPVPFTPTPELVHGVEISSPSLALALRKAGVFSGKEIKDYGHDPEMEGHVIRDQTGAAIRVEEVSKSVARGKRRA